MNHKWSEQEMKKGTQFTLGSILDRAEKFLAAEGRSDSRSATAIGVSKRILREGVEIHGDREHANAAWEAVRDCCKASGPGHVERLAWYVSMAVLYAVDADAILRESSEEAESGGR